MSGMGLDRAKNASQGSQREAKTGPVSGHDRRDERLGPDDIYNPCQIVG